MTLERRIASAFRMDDETWKRHANPWSGWTRVPILPLLALAVWSRVWLGWGALFPIGGLLAWTWLNPRVFPPAASPDRWMSKGTLGERVWLNRDRVPVPDHHTGVPTVLMTVSGIGSVVLIWGLATLSVWPTVVGTVVAIGGKLWFIDRMAWLYEDTIAAPSSAYDRWMSLTSSENPA